MEPIFGLESSGTEDVSPENNEAEEIEKAQEIPREDYEKKKTELLKKIKSFGLATAPLDNLSGTKKEQNLKSSEEEVRVESSETPASPEVQEADKDAATAGLLVILTILSWGMMDVSLASLAKTLRIQTRSYYVGLLGLPGYTFLQSA